MGEFFILLRGSFLQHAKLYAECSGNEEYAYTRDKKHRAEKADSGNQNQPYRADRVGAGSNGAQHAPEKRRAAGAA